MNIRSVKLHILLLCSCSDISKPACLEHRGTPFSHLEQHCRRLGREPCCSLLPPFLSWPAVASVHHQPFFLWFIAGKLSWSVSMDRMILPWRTPPDRREVERGSHGSSGPLPLPIWLRSCPWVWSWTLQQSRILELQLLDLFIGIIQQGLLQFTKLAIISAHQFWFFRPPGCRWRFVLGHLDEKIYRMFASNCVYSCCDRVS